MKNPWRRTLCAILLASPAGAGNLLPTGRFDDPADVDPGWIEIETDGEMTWDGTRDVDECTNSGVAELENFAIAASAAVNFFSCAPAVPGETSLRLGASFYFPTQTRDGQANLAVFWLDKAACVGNSLGSVSAPAALSTLEEQWIGIESEVVSPSGTASAMIAVMLIKDLAGSTLTARMDEVFLTPTTDLFLEDLEVGETCRWSFESLGGP